MADLRPINYIIKRNGVVVLRGGEQPVLGWLRDRDKPWINRARCKCGWTGADFVLRRDCEDQLRDHWRRCKRTNPVSPLSGLPDE